MKGLSFVKVFFFQQFILLTLEKRRKRNDCQCPGGGFGAEWPQIVGLFIHIYIYIGCRIQALAGTLVFCMHTH